VLRGSNQLISGASAGPLFETAVLGQLHRLFVHRGEPSPLYFWRTAAGHEVDFVIEDGPRLIPIEAKLTATPTSREAAGIEAFQKLFGKRAQGLRRLPLSAALPADAIGRRVAPRKLLIAQLPCIA
jgi:predicted AAA+ superfamily ATPase